MSAPSSLPYRHVEDEHRLGAVHSVHPRDLVGYLLSIRAWRFTGTYCVGWTIAQVMAKGLTDGLELGLRTALIVVSVHTLLAFRAKTVVV